MNCLRGRVATIGIHEDFFLKKGGGLEDGTSSPLQNSHLHYPYQRLVPTPATDESMHKQTTDIFFPTVAYKVRFADTGQNSSRPITRMCLAP